MREIPWITGQVSVHALTVSLVLLIRNSCLFLSASWKTLHEFPFRPHIKMMCPKKSIQVLLYSGLSPHSQGILYNSLQKVQGWRSDVSAHQRMVL